MTKLHLDFLKATHDGVFIVTLSIAWLVRLFDYHNITPLGQWAETIVVRFSFGDGPHTLTDWAKAMSFLVFVTLLSALIWQAILTAASCFLGYSPL